MMLRNVFLFQLVAFFYIVNLNLVYIRELEREQNGFVGAVPEIVKKWSK